MNVSTLVLGVGNILMSDDGVGVRLMEQLRDLAPALPGVEYVDAGTLSFVLLPQIQSCDALLVLDAARLDQPPGSMQLLHDEAMDEFLRTARCSVHEVGMRDLLDMARLTGSLPPRRAFLGLQPRDTGWGEALSPEVAATLPQAALSARGVLEDWLARST